MKKIWVPIIAIIAVISIILTGCNSTPEPPVSKLLHLDELVTEGMSISQVDALCKPALRQTGTLYQAESVEFTAKGNWKVTSKEGGFEEGEEGPYQALFFTPTKEGTDYFVVFFKDGKVMDKAWFAQQGAYLIEKILKGESFSK